MTPAHLTPNEPATGLYPSGHAPPAVQSGFTRAIFDDFTGTTLASEWDSGGGGGYNGQSGAAQPEKN